MEKQFLAAFELYWMWWRLQELRAWRTLGSRLYCRSYRIDLRTVDCECQGCSCDVSANLRQWHVSTLLRSSLLHIWVNTRIKDAMILIGVDYALLNLVLGCSRRMESRDWVPVRQVS